MIELVLVDCVLDPAHKAWLGLFQRLGDCELGLDLALESGKRWEVERISETRQHKGLRKIRKEISAKYSAN